MKFLITFLLAIQLQLVASDYLYLTTISESQLNQIQKSSKVPVWYFERLDEQGFIMVTALRKADRIEKYAENFQRMNAFEQAPSFWCKNRLSTQDPQVFFTRQKNSLTLNIATYRVPKQQTQEFEKILQSNASSIIASYSKQNEQQVEYLLFCKEKLPQKLQIGKMATSYEVVFRKDLSQPLKIKAEQKKITFSPALQPTPIFPKV